MKKTAVEAEIVRIPFTGEVRPAWSPGTVRREKSTTVYRVATDAGLTGFGAGQDPFAIEQIFRTVVNWGGAATDVPIAGGKNNAGVHAIGRLP